MREARMLINSWLVRSGERLVQQVRAF